MNEKTEAIDSVRDVVRRWYLVYVRFNIVWNDAWIGVYWKYENLMDDDWLNIYICFVPFVPLRLQFIRSDSKWWEGE